MMDWSYALFIIYGWAHAGNACFVTNYHHLIVFTGWCWTAFVMGFTHPHWLVHINGFAERI